MSAQAQAVQSQSAPQRPIVEVIAAYPQRVGLAVWLIPDVELEQNRVGHKVLPGRENMRILFSVANAICGTAEPLTTAELDFLCDLTSTPYAEVALHLDITRATVSIWMKKARPLSRTFSVSLKKWFWQKLFAKNLSGPVLFEVGEAFDDARLLAHLQQVALEQGLAGVATRGEKQELTPSPASPAPAPQG